MSSKFYYGASLYIGDLAPYVSRKHHFFVGFDLFCRVLSKQKKSRRVRHPKTSTTFLSLLKRNYSFQYDVIFVLRHFNVFFQWALRSY
jgi:hypothetical protein